MLRGINIKMLKGQVSFPPCLSGTPYRLGGKYYHSISSNYLYLNDFFRCNGFWTLISCTYLYPSRELSLAGHPALGNRLIALLPPTLPGSSSLFFLRATPRYYCTAQTNIDLTNIAQTRVKELTAGRLGGLPLVFLPTPRTPRWSWQGQIFNPNTKNLKTS